MTHPPATSCVDRVYATPEPSLSVMLREESDEALMILYQKGNVRAFDTLLARHRGPVYNFILRSVRSTQTAEDLLQETFLRVIKGAASYKKKAKFTTWLYTIARNLCVDNSRRRKHRDHASLDQPLAERPDAGTCYDVLEKPDVPVDRVAASQRMQEIMNRAIGELVDEQREVFLMRELLGMPFKEISTIVGVPVNTLKSRMRYALEKLRLELDEYKDAARTLH